MTMPTTIASTERIYTAGSAATAKHAPTDAPARTPKRTAPAADAKERTAAQPTANAPARSAESTAEPAPSDKPASAEPVRTARRPLRTIADYDRHYHAKTGDDPTVPHGFSRAYLPERGWCQYRHDSEAHLFLVWAVSGDGRFWHDWARATGLELGCTAIVTICTRPIRPYIRLWHWHIEHTETRGGKHRFHCRTADGRPVLITHKHTDPDGQDAYWVTEHLTERNDTHG